jgi:hypothetical protein
MAKQLTISLPPITEESSWSPIHYSPFHQTDSSLFPEFVQTTFRAPLSPLKLYENVERDFPPTPPCSPNSDPVERAPNTPRPLKRKERSEEEQPTPERSAKKITNDPSYPPFLIKGEGKKNYKYNPDRSVHQALFLYQNDLPESHILEHSFFCKFDYCPYHHQY